MTALSTAVSPAHLTTPMSDSSKSERRIPAIAVSRGIGIGRVEILRNADVASFRIRLDEAAVHTEIERFQNAVSFARAGLEKIAANAASGENNSASTVFDVHRLILESSFVENIEITIRKDRVNAEWAIREVCDLYRERQRSVSDAHLREKELDIADVGERLINELSATQAGSELYPGVVLVARELKPTNISELAKFQPAGIITEHGGWTSHTSILAREFEIPMVSGIKLSPADVSPGDLVVVDGNNGEVILAPGPDTLKGLSISHASIHNGLGDAVSVDGTTTLDGTAITIEANVDVTDLHSLATATGVQGIGLYRSESLIPTSDGFPSEEDQYQAYCRIAVAAGPFGVNIRTFDVGPEALHGQHSSPQLNPSLGLRSIRLGLSQPEDLRRQIRAIIRANTAGNVGILLPMVSGIAEIRTCRAMVNEEYETLKKIDAALPCPRLGAMVEVPSAVLTVNHIARNVDFICLGTNDLVQYLLAVDRDNELAAEWYETLHPAVIRALREVATAGSDAGIPVIACGEMAGSPFYVPLLIGLGIRVLSMTVKSVRPVRRLIAGIGLDDAEYLADAAGQLETAAEIENLLRRYYLEHWEPLFPPGLLAAKHR